MMVEDRALMRRGRAASVLHETISHFIAENASKESFITVSYVDLNKTANFIKVYCTVFPKEKEASALHFLKRKERDCKDYIKKHTLLRTIPTVRFFVSAEK